MAPTTNTPKLKQQRLKQWHKDDKTNCYKRFPTPWEHVSSMKPQTQTMTETWKKHAMCCRGASSSKATAALRRKTKSRRRRKSASDVDRSLQNRSRRAVAAESLAAALPPAAKCSLAKLRALLPMLERWIVHVTNAVQDTQLRLSSGIPVPSYNRRPEKPESGHTWWYIQKSHH